MSERPSTRRSAARIVIAALFVVLAFFAWMQVFDDVRNVSQEPLALTTLQAVIGALAALTSWGAWVGARWSAALALAYGLVTAGMIVALGPILSMPVEERGGLLYGAATVLVVTLPCAWYLRRAAVRAETDDASSG